MKVLRFNRLWWLLCWCCLLGLVSPVGSQTLMLEQASARLEVAHQPAAEAQVQLPYRWDHFYPGQSGRAVFKLAFALERIPELPYGLFISRMGNAYELQLNGQVLQSHGDLMRFNDSDYKRPHLLFIAPGLLRLSNELQITLRADASRRAALSGVLFAPWADAEAAYWQTWRWRVMGSLGITLFSALIGLVGLALWATQPQPSKPGRHRREPVYLLGGLANIFWFIRVGDSLLETPLLPWPWWGVVSAMALGCWACFTVLFCVEVAGWRENRWAKTLRTWLTVLLMAEFFLAVWAYGFGYPMALTVWYLVLGLTFFGFGLVFMRHAWVRGSLQSRMLALAVLVNVMAGLFDLYYLRIRHGQAEVGWLYYTSVLFGVAAGLIVLMKFQWVTTLARELNISLGQRIAAKEEELKLSYEKVEQFAREQVRTQERGRILRDMHDGVGAHLTSAIRQLESGEARPSEVLLTLRDSLDQLKLSVDAMNTPPGDVTAMLASLRYRLTSRFSSIGMTLEWAVDALEPIERLNADAMRQLQFMVYEAISNVLQHSQATVLRLEAFETDGAARVRIVDNGVGFAANAEPPKGLGSLRERARSLGLRLLLQSQPGCTVVAIEIPRSAC